MNQHPRPHLQAQIQSPAGGATRMPAHFPSSLQAQMQSQLHPQVRSDLQMCNLVPVQNSSFISSPLGSIPLTGGVKRAPQKPPVRPPGQTTTGTSPSNKTAEVTPAARRKKPKLSEKMLPDRVAALLPESALYSQLLDFEARVDATLARKKMDVQESLKNSPSIQKTLRIYVFNTYANQNQAMPDKMNSESPSWSLKIMGRILDDPVEAEPAGVLKPNLSYPKFSSFFKKITITLDPTLYPDNSVIAWESARSTAQQEGFEVKRIGDKEFVASIRLEINYSPDKFKLSPPLMDVLGIEVETRPKIVAAIWHYVKARKLQNQNEPSFFACDPPLKKVFGEEKMKFSMVFEKISPHLSSLQPIHLEHKIRLSGSQPVGNACFDVLVDVPFPLQKEMSSFLANTRKYKEIEACDDVISAALKKIHEHQRRRAFFLGFSQSPVEFINALISSQSRDLKLAAGEFSRNAERVHRSEFYNQPWVEDAVLRYLYRKPVGGNDAAGSS